MFELKLRVCNFKNVRGYPGQFTSDRPNLNVQIVIVPLKSQKISSGPTFYPKTLSQFPQIFCKAPDRRGGRGYFRHYVISHFRAHLACSCRNTGPVAKQASPRSLYTRFSPPLRKLISQNHQALVTWRNPWGPWLDEPTHWSSTQVPFNGQWLS